MQLNLYIYLCAYVSFDLPLCILVFGNLCLHYVNNYSQVCIRLNIPVSPLDSESFGQHTVCPECFEYLTQNLYIDI